ncbi:hypothetical protein ACWEIM_15275 [Streptomyces sp. NPDC004778]
MEESQLRAMALRHGARVSAWIAADPDATPALPAELARHEPPVRGALRLIAQHHDATAPALLTRLEDDEARPVAARHPALPPDVVTGLVAGADLRSAEAAAASPSLPPTAMAERLPPPPVRAESPGRDARPAPLPSPKPEPAHALGCGLATGEVRSKSGADPQR